MVHLITILYKQLHCWAKFVSWNSECANLALFRYFRRDVKMKLFLIELDWLNFKYTLSRCGCAYSIFDLRLGNDFFCSPHNGLVQCKCNFWCFKGQKWSFRHDKLSLSAWTLGLNAMLQLFNLQKTSADNWPISEVSKSALIRLRHCNAILQTKKQGVKDPPAYTSDEEPQRKWEEIEDLSRISVAKHRIQLSKEMASIKSNQLCVRSRQRL